MDCHGLVHVIYRHLLLWLFHSWLSWYCDWLDADNADLDKSYVGGKYSKQKLNQNEKQ